MLKITEPIIYIDIETSGVSIVKDRVCSIAAKKVMPDGTSDTKYTLVDPEMHIPAEATAIHGITDLMIKEYRDGKGAFTFKQIANSMFKFFQGATLITYNGGRFDIPLLVEEFARCGINFPEAGTKTIDAMTIFHEKEKRDLTAAVKFYADEVFGEAHNALDDILATEKVLNGQIKMYKDLVVMSIEELAEFTRKKDRVDFAGKLKRTEDNIIVFNFGKHYEKPVSGIFKTDKSYYTFLMSEKFECTTDTSNWFTKIYNHVNGIK